MNRTTLTSAAVGRSQQVRRAAESLIAKWEEKPDVLDNVDLRYAWKNEAYDFPPWLDILASVPRDGRMVVVENQPAKRT